MKSPPFWQKLLIIPPILIGGVLFYMMASGKKPPARTAPSEPATFVRTITLKPHKLVPYVKGYGTVKPGRVWNAVAQVAGRIEYVHPDFKKGAILKAGTEIVRISPQDYNISIRRAEANIRAAAAKIAELEVRMKNTRALLAVEREALAISEREYTRKRSLAKRNILSKAAQDQEQRALLVQRKRVLDLESTLNLLPSQIKAQQEQKAVAEAELATARLNLARTHIQLPFDARIAEAKVEVTQYVTIGTLLGTADSMNTAEIEAQMPVTQFRSLFQAGGRANRGKQTAPAMTPMNDSSFARLVQRFGLTAMVRLSIGNQQISWPARVVRISDTVDPKTRTLGAIVAVDNAYAQAIPGIRPPLIKGMFVEVIIRARPLPDQLIIPRIALHQRQIAIVNPQNRLELRTVKLKFVQDDLAVIETGLAAGDRVIVSDLSPMISGMLLKAQEDTQLARRLEQQAETGGQASKQ